MLPGSSLCAVALSAGVFMPTLWGLLEGSQLSTPGSLTSEIFRFLGEESPSFFPGTMGVQ